MKKFSKALGVLSALALIGAGFVSCSDDGSDPEPKAALSGDKIEIASGADTISGTATITLTDTTFVDGTSALVNKDVSTYITLTAGTGVTISEVKLTELTDSKTAKASFSGTVDSGAASGTISAVVKAAATKAGKDLAATGAIEYTIKTTGGGGGGSGTHEVDITTLTPTAVGITVTAQPKAFEAALGTVTKIGDYFTLGPDGADSKCKWYVRSTTEKMNALQLGHSSDYKSAKGTKGAYVEFTVTGTGTFTVSGQSTGDTNTSDASLFDSEGNAVPEKNGKTSIMGKTVVDLTFENLGAGTYTFSSTGSSSSNLRVTKLKVVEN